jgi:hypothetical protein
MLAPIPNVLLKDSAVLHVPVSMDEYQKPVYMDYPVRHVHIQNSNEVKHSSINEEIVLRAILFIDNRRSSPKYDYMSLVAAAQAIGADMTVTVTDSGGNSLDYTVVLVDSVPDVPSTRTHHTEIGLV